MKRLDRNARDALLIRAAIRLEEYAVALDACGIGGKPVWVRNDAKQLRELARFPDPTGGSGG